MYDFRDVHYADKAEQIRAYSMEKAIESLSGMEYTDDELQARAAMIEKFILNRNTA